MAKGWGDPDPFNTRAKFHYFGEDGRSLCGKWGNVGLIELEDANDAHPDNCKECRLRKATRDKREEERLSSTP